MARPIKKALVATTEGLLEMANTKESAFAENFFGSDLSLTHIMWMGRTILEKVDEWPVDKTSRWVGFMQGVMACHQILNVKEERDRTRPIFHAAYTEAGENIPSSQERTSY